MEEQTHLAEIERLDLNCSGSVRCREAGGHCGNSRWCHRSRNLGYVQSPRSILFGGNDMGSGGSERARPRLLRYSGGVMVLLLVRDRELCWETNSKVFRTARDNGRRGCDTRKYVLQWERIINLGEQQAAGNFWYCRVHVRNEF